jgi:hypothetical protein
VKKRRFRAAIGWPASRSIVAEAKRENVFPAQGIFTELAMAFGAEIVPAAAGNVRGVTWLVVTDLLQHLVQFGQMVDVIFEIIGNAIDHRLDLDHHHVPRFECGVDLTFTTIASVMDHRTTFPLEGDRDDATGHGARSE